MCTITFSVNISTYYFLRRIRVFFSRFSLRLLYLDLLGVVDSGDCSVIGRFARGVRVCDIRTGSSRSRSSSSGIRGSRGCIAVLARACGSATGMRLPVERRWRGGFRRGQSFIEKKQHSDFEVRDLKPINMGWMIC